MRDVDIDFMTALTNARDRGIVPRKLVTAHAKALDDATSITPFSFWSDDDDVTINVTSALTQQVEARLFIGGVNLSIDTIPRVSDLTIQTVTASLSQIAPAAQELARGYDIRLAKVEVFEALLDPRTKRLISNPYLVFLGEIDDAEISTPTVSDEGSIQISFVSDAISMLTRKNAKKSSYENQKRRNNDQFSKWSNSAKDWTPTWGS